MTAPAQPPPRPQFWVIFGAVTAALSFFTGLTHGLVEATMVFAAAVAFAFCVWRVAVMWWRRAQGQPIGRADWLFVTGGVVALLLIGLAAVLRSAGRSASVSTIQGGSTSSGGTASPSGGPTYCYFDKATEAFQDRQVNLAKGGYIQQSFPVIGCRSIGAVAVIVAREHRPGQDFSDSDIGLVELQLFRVSSTDSSLLPVPIAPAGDGVLVSGDGITVQGANNRDAVFEFKPIAVHAGERYVIRITNVIPGGILSPSVRPAASDAGPTEISGEVENPADHVIAHALSGYVCEESSGC